MMAVSTMIPMPVVAMMTMRPRMTTTIAARVGMRTAMTMMTTLMLLSSDTHSMRETFAAVLTSPHFLYLVETRDPGKADSAPRAGNYHRGFTHVSPQNSLTLR